MRLCSWALPSVSIIPKKIHFGKWNDSEICSVKWNSGWNGDRKLSSLRYVTLIFSWFMECKPEISGTLFRNSGKIKVSIIQTGIISWFHSVNITNSCFLSVNQEKFPGSIMYIGKISGFPFWKPEWEYECVSQTQNFFFSIRHRLYVYS